MEKLFQAFQDQKSKSFTEELERRNRNRKNMKDFEKKCQEPNLGIFPIYIASQDPNAVKPLDDKEEGRKKIYVLV